MTCIYLTDLNNISDTYISGLGEIEDLGDGCLRFTFYVKHHAGGGEELVVVSKIVAPKSAVVPAMLMAAKAIGMPTTIITAFSPHKALH